MTSAGKRSVRLIVAMCEGQGCTVTQARSKLRIKTPGGSVVSLHQSPTDRDAWVNMTRQALTRAGLTWTLDIGRGSPASKTPGRNRRSAKEGNTP